MNKPKILTIAILCESMEHYKRAVDQFLPDLERHHNVKFIKNYADFTYKAESFRVIPALHIKNVLGLANYQLIKYGRYHLNKHSGEIIDHWERDNFCYKNKSPTKEQIAAKVKE